MIAGTVYGVVLNDAAERGALAAAFAAPPYQAPPQAPVVYIKPRTCFGFGGAPVPVPAQIEAVQVAATLALLFGRDVTGVAAADALDGVAAAALAIDVCVAHADYYRPAIAQRCRDGFLPVGRFGAVPAGGTEIVTRIDGAAAHRWPLDRLVRPIPTLIADLAAFMTLRAGDVLLVGLAGDAPLARAGQSVEVSADGLATLATRLVAEDAA